MTNETKAKWRQRYHRAKEKVAEWLPWLALGATTAFIVEGCSSGIQAKKEVTRLRKWADQECVPKANKAIHRGMETESRVTDLERQVNTLMEKALNETEGKESA